MNIKRKDLIKCVFCSNIKNMECDYMKRRFAISLIFILVSGFSFAKENLAILPFTGGQGNEGETIAELFSYDPQINNEFYPIPRTTIARAISSERRFQMDSGMTDSDTVISIANEVGARYVVAGNITSVGNNRLLIISIIDIKNLQQIAGDVQTYNRIEEIRGKLPNMAANIIQATKNNTSSLPKLAVVPIQLEGGADQRIADTLAQLLAIHIIRTGVYAVFPRTQSLDQVMDEHNAQMMGHTADRNIIGIGHGENPDYVLSVAARRLGNSNMFNAGIIDLESRRQIVGRSVDYHNINEGMRAMETLAMDLTSTSEQVGQRRQAEEERRREEERQRLEAERRAEAMKNFMKNSGLGLGFRTGFSVNNIIPGNPFPIESNIPMFFPLSALIELKLGYFSIQTELQYTIGNYAPGNYRISSSFQGDEQEYIVTLDGTNFGVLQIPLLAKITFSPSKFIISPFAGIGFNIPIGIRNDENPHNMFGGTETKIDVFLPNSGITGINVGLELGKMILFTDFRYIWDLEYMSAVVELTSGNQKYNTLFSSKRTSFDVSIGIRWFIPFR
jgi:TolB-like protein